MQQGRMLVRGAIQTGTWGQRGETRIEGAAVKKRCALKIKKGLTLPEPGGPLTLRALVNKTRDREKLTER